MKLVFALIVAIVVSASSLHAGDQLHFPRIRQLRDLVNRASDSRYRDPQGLLGQSAFTAGASAGYISDYYYKGFRLEDSKLLFRGDAYVNIYGIEASVWGIWDADREQYRPRHAEYRIRYKFELEGALWSLGYSFNDFSGGDGDYGSRKQGFGNKRLEQFKDDKFPSSTHQLEFHMTYFTGLVQDGGANMRFSLDVDQRLDDEGTRVATTVGFFVSQKHLTFFGNFIEIASTTVYQHRYFTNESDFQGDTISGRIAYDLYQDLGIPLMFEFEVHYFVPIQKELVDALFFGGKISINF